eukprot:TRINITY_DN2296_c0_g1_i1.p1 TRINITY_DN2296_c0_g1~~TRINITY_DN2296_c0_g1_i1.p1  ORF type:complete len:507 (-),score=171.58 TRINITY_DN2296_c0_g1_i1:118-1602(-)
MSGKDKKAIVRSVERATSKTTKPSKDKHVRIIILQTHKMSSIQDIIRALTKRLDKRHWAVVLKSLMIFHRLFRDGDKSLIEAMKSTSSVVFALRAFSASAPPNHLFTVFVKKYAKYLEEKVSVLRLLGYQFEKDGSDAIKALKGDQWFKTIPKLQSQLNALLNCKMKSQHVGTHLLIHHTYILLCQDALLLYSQLNTAIKSLTHRFWKMGKKRATKTMNIYKLYVKETDALIGLYEIGRNFIKQLPKVKKAELDIIDKMEDYVDDLESESEEESEEGPSDAVLNTRPQADYESDSSEYEDDSGSEGSSSEYEDSSEDEDEAQPDFMNNFFAGMPSGMAANPFIGGGVPQASPYAITAGPGASPFASSSPFTNSSSPFTTAPSSSSPFTTAPSASPFGTNTFTSQTQSANAFGAQSSPAVNPFASSSQPAAPAANPFASSASPFGNQQLVVQQQQSPFGNSPFGGGGAQPSPFGAPQAANNSPFGAPRQSTNPFL